MWNRNLRLFPRIDMKRVNKASRLSNMETWARLNNVRNRRVLTLYAEQNFEISNTTARNYANIVLARLYRSDRTAQALQTLWNMLTGRR